MGRRPERLAEGIREEVARIVATEVKDPRLGFVTITRVEVTHDLGLARVLVGVLGDETERQRSMAALQSATGFVRREIGRRLRIRVVPEIEFRYDKGIDATDRVARLLEEQRSGAERSRRRTGRGDGRGPRRGGRGRRRRTRRRADRVGIAGGRCPRRRQAAGSDFARHRGPGSPRAARAAHRPHGHARPLRDRRPAPVRRPRDAPRPVPVGRRQGLPGEREARLRDDHRRPHGRAAVRGDGGDRVARGRSRPPPRRSSAVSTRCRRPSRRGTSPAVGSTSWRGGGRRPRARRHR